MNTIEKTIMMAGFLTAMLVSGAKPAAAADARPTNLKCVEDAGKAYSRKAKEYEELSKKGSAELSFALYSRPAAPANAKGPNAAKPASEEEGGFLSLCPRWRLEISLIGRERTGFGRTTALATELELGSTVGQVMDRMVWTAFQRMYPDRKKGVEGAGRLTRPF